MERVYISDRTLKQGGKQMPLSFREKIELSRLIDRLEVDAIELSPIENKKVDSLLIKSVCLAVKKATVAVPVAFSPESVSLTWNSLKDAHKSRLQVCAPVSSVQMEYLFHLKPAAMKEKVTETIRECRKYTDQVELIAEDASRADSVFLAEIVSAAIEAGAAYVTFQEAAGTSLPEEMKQVISGFLGSLPSAEKVRFGIDCSDELSLADACAVETVQCGIREIKAAAFPLGCASLANIVRILALKGEKFGVFCGTRREELKRVTAQISSLCRTHFFPAVSGTEQAQMDDTQLSFHDSRESILHAMDQLGYILDPGDQEKVYQAFLNVTEKKNSITLRELDALIAAVAMQAPPVYSMMRFVINTGNEIGAMAHMKILYRDKVQEGVSTGDGAIDAAFLAIEKAVGKHYELDDFQIQAITEGREAMGETIVRLRSQGKLYSGRGISTDILGSSVMAYINALNKIAFVEDEE